MKKLLILIGLAAIAAIALKFFGYTSLLFVAPVIAAVLYGANGSVYVEVPHKSEEDVEGATTYFNKKGKTYVNRDYKTYEMTRKGYKYNWGSRLGKKKGDN